MGYCGVVYHGESGLPMAGIPVTDGRNITITDETGAFILPGWERARLDSHGNVLWFHPTKNSILPAEAIPAPPAIP